MNLNSIEIDSISIDMPSKKIGPDDSNAREQSRNEINILVDTIRDSYKIIKEFNPHYQINIKLKNGENREIQISNDEITENQEVYWRLKNADVIRDIFHKSNITNDKEIQLLKLKQNNPTKNWLIAFLDGFGTFNKYIIIEAEYLFEQYIYNLLRIDGKSIDKIVECIDNTMSEFNRINSKYDDFIMTVAREEILEFLSKGAIIAGLDKESDIERMIKTVRDW